VMLAGRQHHQIVRRFTTVFSPTDHEVELAPDRHHYRLQAARTLGRIRTVHPAVKMERAARLAVVQLDPARNPNLTGRRIRDLDHFLARDGSTRAVEFMQIEDHRANPPGFLAGGSAD